MHHRWLQQRGTAYQQTSTLAHVSPRSLAGRNTTYLCCQVYSQRACGTDMSSGTCTQCAMQAVRHRPLISENECHTFRRPLRSFWEFSPRWTLIGTVVRLRHEQQRTLGALGTMQGKTSCFERCRSKASYLEALGAVLGSLAHWCDYMCILYRWGHDCEDAIK